MPRGRPKGSTKPDANIRHPLYRRWAAMKQRCYNPHDAAYKWYGGRGITVDDRWHTFANFASDMGPCPSWEYTLERKDNDGPYSRENCVWADQKTQQNNRRNNVALTHNGKTQNISQWAEELKIPEHILHTRVRKLGMTIEEAINYSRFPKKLLYDL
jgi:hypothetical protein